ncbi:MAG: outer membrane protein assembly factor BamA [Nitrospiraceae bacterium]|nr:outer membrane protein assembly factor BamA [Nitrospiraceae bacterium]
MAVNLKLKPRPVVLACLSLLLLFTALGSARAAEPTVIGIEIRGLKRIEEGVVRRLISQQVGEPLSPRKITTDIKHIYQTGYFEDVKVEGEPFEGGLKLIYVVREKPTIRKIDFYGNKEVKTEDIQKQIKISPGSVADTVLINDNASKITAYYESEGYSLTRVVPVVRTTAANQAVLTYVINEGPRIKIKEIRFIGNKALKSGEIRAAMKSKPRSFFSFLFKSGYYKKDDLLADSERIKDLYFDHGYIQAVVQDPKTTLTPDKKWAIITYAIQEGEQFRVSKTSFAGNKIVGTEELRKLLATKVGEPVSRKLVRQDVIDLTDRYSEHGYALAVINPELIPDAKKKTVAIIYRISEGDLYHIGRIEISGNQKTRDWVIRREVLLNEGDIFNSKLLRKSYERINNLNFFDSVTMDPQPVPPKKEVNVDINVKERPTGFLSVGGGYSSVDKIIGMVDITQGNLGGRGQAITLKGELGGLSSYYEFSFKEPWLFGRRLSLTTSIYKQHQDYLDYNREATGGEIGLSKPISENTWISADYRLEDATITNILSDASPIIQDQVGTKLTSSITPGIVRDTRDNYLDPHTGSRNSLYVTFAGIGGDNKFLKVVAESGWFLPVTRTTTVSLHGVLGYGTGLLGQELPLYERFYVGGIYTVRGLAFGEGGPLDINGQPIGGKNEVIGNFDYIYPLVSAIKLKGDVFFDTGTAYDSLVPRDFRYTSGLGIRWISPLGPIRLEWGYNLNKKPGEQTSRFEFAFGTFF